jgi:hypothetical protein
MPTEPRKTSSEKRAEARYARAVIERRAAAIGVADAIAAPHLILDMVVTCTKCAKPTVGRLHFNDEMRIIDSDGGILFDHGWMCHNCTGDPWSSADLTVELS